MHNSNTLNSLLILKPVSLGVASVQAQPIFAILRQAANAALSVPLFTTDPFGFMNKERQQYEAAEKPQPGRPDPKQLVITPEQLMATLQVCSEHFLVVCG